MAKRRVFTAWVVVCLASVGAGLAQSQATTGVIEGEVRDDSDAVLRGVTVTLLNTDTNYSQVVETNDSGRFRGTLLPLGPYRVTAELEGFSTLVREGIQLTIGRVIDLDLTLGISAVGEEIVVTDEAPLIEASRIESSVLIDRDTIDGIANNGRNFLELTKMTPGVSLVQGPDGEELTINGQKGIQNNISVDGADFNNPFFGEQRGGQRPAFTFNIDAIQEFVVVPDGAPAEFGRSSGGFVQVVTKSGSNAYKGSAHLFFKNDSLSTEAERADGTKEPKFPAEQYQTGFTLGGPITEDRMFFFVSADVQRGDQTKQNDPARIEQRVVDALAALGSPNENAPIKRTDDAQVFLGKVDWQAADDQLLTLRYSYTDAEQKNGTFDVDSWGVSANAVEQDSSNAVSGSLISTLGSNLLNEARFQWAREDRPRPYEGPTFAGTDRPLPDTAFDFGNSYRFGMPFFIPVKYHDTRWQVNENLSWQRGDHSFKGGIEWNQTAAFQTFIGFANGRFIFGSTDGFLNYVSDPTYVECSDGSTGTNYTCPGGTSITGPVLLYLQQAGANGNTVEEAGTQTITQTEPAIFFQDNWKPRSNVTVQYGVRWEQLDNPDLITPRSELFYAPFIGQTVSTAAGPQEFPGDGTIPDDDVLQPRLGIAWDPWSDGKTVIRANAGVYGARVPGLNLASSRSTDGTRGQTLFRNSELIGVLGPPPPYTQLIDPSAVGDPFLPDVFVFDKNFEIPETDAYSVSVEREVRSNLSLLYKFNYAKTDNLTRFVNRNDPLLGSPWSTGLAPGGFNGINTLTVVESSARSEYTGHTIGVTKRGDKVQYQAYYTYSKDKSDDDNERDPFTFRYAKVTDLDAEFGYSDRDQRDRFNGWLLWAAPGGFDINFRYTYRSPQPLSLTSTGAVAQTPQDRINPDGSVTQRNLGRKDNEFSSLDIRVSKRFKVGDMELEGIIDIFNLANQRNQFAPQTTNLIFNFDGTVQSGLGDPRQIQLGARLVW
jgi:Carboxypeptidase regulatory-like domain/TonB-dependent Receptor Plug Domain